MNSLVETSPVAVPHPAGHRKSLPWMAALLLLGAGVSQARLGESPVRVEARYGVPVKVENGVCARDFQCTYKHGGITIVVHFLDEKSQNESYTNDSGDAIAADEIQRLLEVNRRGGKWKLKEDTASAKKWELNSGEAVAAYEPQTHHVLEVKTVWWQHFVEEHPTAGTGGGVERLKDF